MRRTALAWLILPAVVLLPTLGALHDARLPGSVAAQGAVAVALTGATVVVGNGQVIADGTVLIRNGLIAAVGAGLPVPRGATEIDARSSFVYPGFIDALTDQGLRQDRAATPSAGSQEPADTRSAAMFADVRAADRLDPDVRLHAVWREGGVLALNVAPTRGIFMGQSALVNLNGDPPERAIVRPSVAMRVSLQGLGFRNRRRGQGEPGGVFPTRLIGVIGYVRQTLIDAREYDEAHAVFESRTRPLPRPQTDRALDALRAVVHRAMPLVCPAQEEREVQRVVDLAAEMNVSCVVAGGNEAHRLAEPLKKLRIPVLVSLNYPTGETDVPPEFEVPIRVQRFREHAARSAADLAAAGVTFAFYSDGLRSGSEFLERLREAVAAGLSKDAAIRAASLSAAEILGVDQLVGSVEAGKIANLIVASGDLMDRASAIQYVFVDGRRFDAPKPAAKRSGTDAVAANAASLSAAAVARQPIGAGAGSAPAPPEILIRNATVMTVSHGTIPQASVLIRGGKIAAIGRNVTGGPRAQVIDATGQFLTPGIVDAHFHYPTDSHNEATLMATSMARIADTLNPTDIIMWRELAGGVTTAHVMHGSVNPVGGQNALIKMRWGKSVPELLFEHAPKLLKLAVGEYPGRTGLTPPSSVMGMETIYREWLAKARAYAEERKDDQAARTAGITPLLPPHRDLQLEPLVEVLRGERQVHVHSFKPQEMLMLMRVANDFGFKIRMFHHASGAYQVAEELARHGAAATIFGDFTIDTLYNAALLTRKGVLTSINSDSDRISRYLYQQAAMVMKYGDLTEDEALALVTLNPAKQFGIDDRVGSIDPGKDADLVLFDRHPLSVYAVPQTVFIDGEIYFSRDKERARLQEIDAERAGRGLPRPAPAAVISRSAAPGAAAIPAPAAPAAMRPVQPGASGAYLIAGARIVTVSGPVIENGSVLIRQGRIAEVGPGVIAAPDALRIDGTGLTVYPGLFDANTAIGIAETAVETTLGPFMPHVLAFSSFVAASETVRSSRFSGVTHALVRPAGGRIPGQGAVVHLAGWTSEAMEVARHAALIINFPSVGSLQYSADERFQQTPFSAVKPGYERNVSALKRLFADARAYLDRRSRLTADEARRFVPDARLDALIPAIKGQQLVLIEADSSVDIKAAVQFATGERLSYAILGGLEAWKVADVLKEYRARVILGPTQNVPSGEDDPVDIVYRGAAVLHERGVSFALSTGTPRMFDTDPRALPYQAGNAVAHGLPWDAAIRAVTLTPAEFFGIADRLGSIEKGKIANLVVTAGDILEYRTEVAHLFINGQPVDLSSRHSELYEKYAQRR